MASIAPYLDENGLHAPTFAERLEALTEAYRSIFAPDAALTPETPDYQLLAVFARALDEVTGLLEQVYLSRSPLYAGGAQLDLLLPLYGLTRRAGETDSALRRRIAGAFDTGIGTEAALRAGLLAVPGVTDCALRVNDGESAVDGIPAHSIAAVVLGGADADIARALFDKKAPGIGTCGSVAVTVRDAWNRDREVRFSRPVSVPVSLSVTLNKEPSAEVRAALTRALRERLSAPGIGETIYLSQLYPLCYAALERLPDRGGGICLRGIRALAGQTPGTEVIDIPWNGRAEPREEGVSFSW